MPIRVVQATWGKFHQFDLARQLHKRHMLEAIFSSYPRWALKSQGLPRDKVRTFPWLHTLGIADLKYGLFGAPLAKKLSHWTVTTFDWYVARELPECDVFIALSGAGLGPGRLAQGRGARYVCDRGSSHIRYADRILREEFRRWGQEFEGVDPRFIAREEAEYEQCDAVTVPSEFARRSFTEFGVPAEKVKKIPYGVELSRFHKVAAPPEDSFDVLFVGQVSFRKGVPYLLEAFEQLKHPRKKLRVVGAMQPEMEKFLQGKRFANVEFTGPVPQPQLKEIMSGSHVMVLPSIEEGLAMVQGQALACGCPVISSAHTGGEDLFRHGREGFIVPIRDAKAITERLELLAQDPKLRETMSRAALNLVKNLGGWDAYGEKYAAFCSELAGMAGAKG